MGNVAEIKTAAGQEATVGPPSILTTHHRAGVAEIKLDGLSGGRLLHLALAGCVFNNVLRMASERGFSIDEAGVRVDGDFTEDGASTGIICEVDVKGSATAEQLRALARDAFDNSTVAAVLKRGAEVRLAS